MRSAPKAYRRVVRQRFGSEHQKKSDLTLALGKRCQCFCIFGSQTEYELRRISLVWINLDADIFEPSDSKVGFLTDVTWCRKVRTLDFVESGDRVTVCDIEAKRWYRCHGRVADADHANCAKEVALHRPNEIKLSRAC
jgi:hypothetical protein